MRLNENMDYATFLERKTQLGSMGGFKPTFMPGFLFDFQAAATTWGVEKGRGALFEDCGLGKGQPPESRVLTPKGWRAIQDLSVGDEIFGSDGNPWPVAGVYPKTEQPTYRVHFSDGTSFVVDEDHLHMVRTNNDRQRGKPWRVLDTRTLLALPLRYGQDDKSRNYDIPVVSPVVFSKQELPLDPYLLGALLGDGGLTIQSRIIFSCADAELLETIREKLSAIGAHLTQHENHIDYGIGGGRGNQPNLALKAIQTLGLSGCHSVAKFIPSPYLHSSIEDRLSLLRGLMDTDGYIKESSQHYTVSPQLHQDVLFLIRSLGGCPTSTRKFPQYSSKDGELLRGKPCFIATFSLKNFCPFLLSRKAQKWNATPRDNGRWIDRIEFESVQKTTCISVGSPDQSYVTENFIVTHNTIQQLVWAQNVIEHTNKPVLILTPLAVSFQTVAEAEKFGIEAVRPAQGKLFTPRIYVTNYERLHHMDSAQFAGVVADESSRIKAFDSWTCGAVIEFMRRIVYRLLCTATAAPNDYPEFGTSAEALGVARRVDMLHRYFTHDSGDTGKWRLKKHAARAAFWQWMGSWARAIRFPSDLGFSDEGFILPPLIEQYHAIRSSVLRDDLLFAIDAIGLAEQRAERRVTIVERCEKVAELINPTRKPAIAWCHLNAEGDLLEKLIPDAIQVSGKDSDEAKEEKLLAFVRKETRVLIIKPKIGAHGLNLQHCAHMTTFSSHSFEDDYQQIRRCHRFGQLSPVTVDRVVAEGEQRVIRNRQRKAEQADAMYTALIQAMRETVYQPRSRMAPQHAALFPRWKQGEELHECI